jgi:DNA polymerase-3 subunit beta
MEIRADQETLVKAISAVLGVVDKKSTMPILSNVLIKTNGHGLEIGGTDLEISYKGYCPAQIIEAGAVTVPAHQLSSLVKELPAGELELKSNGKHTLKIQRGESLYKLSGINPDQFPPLPLRPEGGYVEMESKVLKEMLRKVIFSCSGDDLQYHLSSVFVVAVEEGERPYLRLVTTDGHRLTLIQRENPLVGLLSGLDKGIMVSRKGAAEIIRFLGDEEKVSLNLDGNTLTVLAGEKLLAIRLLDKKFPEYQRIIPESFVHRFAFNREELFTTIKRLSLLTSDRFKGVLFKISAETAEVSHQSPDVGEGKERLQQLPVENADPDKEGKFPLEMGFNARYLLEPLAMMTSDQVVLEINETERPARLSDPNDPHYFSIVMPMSA